MVHLSIFQQRGSRIFCAIALLLFSTRANAQCDRTGWVASMMPGCGAVIVDQNTGESLRAVAGIDQLSGGTYMRFSAALALPLPGCSGNPLQTVALTCLTDTLPCLAKFDYASEGTKSLSIAFAAQVYDESAQVCTWSFGDGSSTETGASVAHTFAQSGVYEVCLKVKDKWGATAQQCRKVMVGSSQSLTCGYDIYVTAVGKTLYGKLASQNSNPGELLAVQWSSSKNSKLLAETPYIIYELPHYGNYIVCAEYAVRNPDGTVCFSSACKQLVVAEPSCVQPTLAEPDALCAPYNAPVCGCDGVTYHNECDAMSAGVTDWWIGPCDKIYGTCLADMEATILTNNPSDGFTTRFRNLSGGNYVFAQLDFGDGSPFWKGTQSDSIINHHYATSGIYRTNLTVWSPGGAPSSVTKLVVTDAVNLTEGSLPPGTDYVFPGDANGDKKANVYDLLNIGVGHYVAGVPRPYAKTTWLPQFSPNWPESIAGKVNFKHLDCDGNGDINAYDADVIEVHCQPIDPKKMDWLPQAPRIRLDLKGADTLTLNPVNPDLEIRADILVGSPTEPALGFYGLAFALQYPEFVNHNPEADLATDLFGTSHFLWQSRDHYNRRQLDMGLVKTNHEPVSGYGKIAEVTFKWDYVIIIDVIDRTDSKIIPFVVPVTGIRAIDANGNIKTLSVPIQLDTVWIKLENTSPTTNPALSEQVEVFPNPATDEVLVYLSHLSMEQIEIVNILGQSVAHSAISTGKSTHRFSVAGWLPGLYTLRIQTAEGMVEKRLMVGG